MIKYVTDPDTKQLKLVEETPYIPAAWPETIACIQPDPCPGCGNCRLCNSKCTC